MEAWQALVLGLVEGITEYLPISSTGHLILAQRALGIPGDAAARGFAICIQSGAILAVLSLYLPRVRQMFAGLIGRDAAGRKLLLQLAVAFLPAAIIGLAFKSQIETHLFGLWPVIGAWFVGGVLILAIPRLREPRREGVALEQMTFTLAFAIGLCQALALLPGTSRSLATIGGALLLGLSGAAAVEFSLLLGVITLLAATAHQANSAGSAMLAEYGALNLTLGFLAGFVSAFFAVQWFVGWLRSHGMVAFGIYRIALALLVALLVWKNILPDR